LLGKDVDCLVSQAGLVHMISMFHWDFKTTNRRPSLVLVMLMLLLRLPYLSQSELNLVISYWYVPGPLRATAGPAKPFS